jgi:dipeptidyl-peptidase-4
MLRYFLPALAACLLLTGKLQAQKQISLDDCFAHFRFYPQSASGIRFAPDGLRYLEQTRDGIALMDIAGGNRRSLLIADADLRAMGEWDDYSFSSDLSGFLFSVNVRPVYRHSTLAGYRWYDVQSRRLENIHSSTDIQFAALSPDGRKVAFVLDNNLYFRDMAAAGAAVQITKDGQKDLVINGLPDWVYEEEFSPVDGNGMVAAVWSPDSKKLAYIRFDESAVPYYPIVHYGIENYPTYNYPKYPQAGAANSSVSVHIYDVEESRHIGRPMGLESEDYVPRLHWTRDNRLLIHRLNRRQDTLELLLTIPDRAIFDETKGIYWMPTRLLLRETDLAYVEIFDHLYFPEDGRRYIWSSEQDGFHHLYLKNLDPATASLPRQLTRGAYDVTGFYGLNDSTGKFYYQTATPTPMDRQLWEGSLNGDPPRLLTPGTGTFNAGFSPGFRYFLQEWSDANTPNTALLRSITGDTVRMLTENSRVQQRRKDYGFVEKRFWQFALPDGTSLNGWMLRPDTLETGKKYPVLLDVYGGPGSQTVLNSYDGYYDGWRQMLVQKGVIVVSVDNRGTGARGRDFKKCTQLQLGKLETEDQIAAARYLAALPYVDPERIGIWGWSYGGYLSTSCILKGNDVFKMAMAVAPVANWKWYDSAYTERYMHTPAENKAGYEDNAPINFVHRLKGGNFLLCHGMADDNVHWQQSVELVNALIAAGKQFETHYYPNRNHGIYGDNATLHLFQKLTDFLLKQL